MYFSQEVMQEMLQKIVPGVLPHYFVILTLANLAKENGNFNNFVWHFFQYSRYTPEIYHCFIVV